MNGGAGQAGHLALRVLRWFGALLLGLVVLLAVGAGALAYRLDQGPLQIPFLASRLATLISGQGIEVHIDQAALAWSGYKKGGGAPLYLQLRGLTASNANGVVLAQVPAARLLFPVRALFGMAAPLDVAGSGARLAQSDAAVAVAGLFRFGFGYRLHGADVTVTLGPGHLGPPGQSLTIAAGGFLLHIGPGAATLRDGHLTLTSVSGAAPQVSFAGTAHRDTGWRALLTVNADAVPVGSLPVYWPAGAGAGARRWVLANMHGGAARDARFQFTVAAPADLSDATLTDVTGGFDGTGLTLRWLPAAPPITAMDGHLQVLDPDTILITEKIGQLGALGVSQGSMKITGVSRKDQIATVKLALVGRVADAIAVLNAPRLAVLARAPPQLAQATGAMRATIVATLPLDANLQLKQVRLAVDARLTDLAAPTPVAGLAVTAGTMEIEASATQARVTSDATLAGAPAHLSALAVYDANPVLRHAELQTSLGPEALGLAGLDAETALTDAVAGAVPLDIVVGATPGGGQTATADADLTAATLGVPVLGWSKKSGQPGHLHVQAALDNNDVISVRSLAASGPALDIEGTMQGNVLRLDPLCIGGTAAAGTVTFPASARVPWRLALTGASLDLRLILNRQHGAAAAAAAQRAPPAPGAETPSGPLWLATANFATVHLARPPAPALRNLIFTGSGAGAEVLAANLTASDTAGRPVTLRIDPVPATGRRALHSQAGDGGNLLRVIGAYDDVQGGDLDLTATYGAGAPFAGTVTLTKFQLLQAPALGKVLQGLTIYGVAEAAAGPGLVFSRLVAPFSIAHQVLTLRQARAYSASLGFTAAGTIGLADGATDIDATVIPAYALNALPGKIPVLGALFTAEKGGGLISIRVKVTGQLVSPHVRINPLSALTPGALRGVFGTAPK